MSSSLNEFTQTLQDLRHKISGSWQQNPKFEAIDQSLAVILDRVAQKKQTVQVFSQDVRQGQAIATLLAAQGDLATRCQIVVAPRPRIWAPDPSLLTPLLQILSPNPSYLGLNPDQNYTLGRDPDCSIPLTEADHFVSGHHARLAYNASTATWIIQDTSRNGTFINGKRLEPNQQGEIQSGDRITLGSETTSPQSPEFIFHDPLAKDTKLKQTKSFFDFDIACFTFTFNQEPTQAEKGQIEEIRKHVKTNFYGFIVRDKNDPQTTPFTEETAHAFAKSLIKITKITSSRLAYLDEIPPSEELKRGVPKEKYTLASVIHDIQESCQNSDLDGMLKRLESQVDYLQELINKLQKYEVSIPSKPAADHALIQQKLSENYLKLQVKQALEYIKSRQEAFFKQAENYLTQAEKVDYTFFDELCVDSLACKMQAFAQILKPHVSKRGNKKLLQLRYVSTVHPDPELQSTDPSGSPSGSPSGNPAEPDPGSPKAGKSRAIAANAAMLNFCEYELYTWAQKLWAEIYSELAGGGIQKLYCDILEALAPISSRDLSPLKDAQEFQTLVLQTLPNSEQKFIQVSDEIVIKEPSAASYLMKKIRSQWMQFIFLFSFFSILGIAGRRQIMRNLMAPLINLFHQAPIISSVGLICLIVWGIKLGIKVYQDDLAESRNKQADELRAKLCKHYQELAKKHLVRSYLQSVRRELEDVKKQMERIQSFLESSIKTE